MLRHLSIRHYALIERLDTRFERGLNILTGETGSGKSIILGALGLILGERSDVKVVADGAKKCIVEGTFLLPEKPWKNILESFDIDFDPTTHFRREVTASGKSRAFINDTPVSLKVMKELGMSLVDIHSQHTTLQLNDPDFQMQLVDAFADTGAELESYTKLFAARNEASKALTNAEDQLTQLRGELDFLNFQLAELHEARLDEYRDAEIEDAYNRLAHAEEIARKLHIAIATLSTDDRSVTEGIEAAADAVSGLSSWSKTYAEWARRLESVSIEISDVVREMESHAEEVQVDPAALAKLDEKRARVFALERKHGVVGAEELRKLRDELQGKVSGTEDLEEQVAHLREELERMDLQLKESATALSKKRKSCLGKFSAQITETLARLNMESARFEMEILSLEKPGPRGMDKVEMRFSSNTGHKPRPLKEVASGGELSRLMLAIKKTAPTSAEKSLVLDEIDTGVSGEVANAMGTLMREMGNDRQLLSITHLPQIASKGQTHFRVYKSESEGRTHTRIDRLDKSERIREIAQMLSGARTTETAMDNARELLEEK